MTHEQAEPDRRLLQFVAPRRVALRERPFGRQLGADQIEGPTITSLVSPGTELNSGFDALPGTEPNDRPGYAAVFRVERVGPNVERFSPGDIAMGFGPHATYQRAGERDAFRVPDGLDPTIAPFARLMAIPMATLTTTSARPPGPVGISGLGIVGHLAAKVFAASGFEVFAWDPLQGRRDLLAGEGVHVIDAAPLDPTPVDEDAETSSLLQLVVECSGHEQAVLDSCLSVRAGGEVVLLGTPWRKRSDISAHALTRAIFHRFVVVRSGWETELAAAPEAFRVGDTATNVAGAMRWLVEGRVDVRGLAKTAVPAGAQDVYEGLLSGTWPALTALFDWAAV